jgi:hypothetical protein
MVRPACAFQRRIPTQQQALTLLLVPQRGERGPERGGLVQLILLNTFAVTATRSSSMGAARVEWTLSGYLTEIPSGVP